VINPNDLQPQHQGFNLHPGVLLISPLTIGV
jgi:hypothetical protein